MLNAYGAKTILEAYLGMPLEKAVGKQFIRWQHGWQPEEFNIDLDMIVAEGQGASDLEDEVFLVARKDQEAALRDFGFRRPLAFGLPFAYALKLKPRPPRLRVKDSLLVVPAAHGYDAERDRGWPTDQKYIEHLRAHVGDSSLKSVMIYGDDIEDGRGLNWERAGYSVIRGAQYEDVTSLVRVADVFHSFDFVTTNGIGSHIAYASASGCKVSIGGPQVALVDGPQWPSIYRHRPDIREKTEKAVESVLDSLEALEFYGDPFNARDRLTWGSQQVGLDEIKSREQTVSALTNISKRKMKMFLNGAEDFSSEVQSSIRRVTFALNVAAPRLRPEEAWNSKHIFGNLLALGTGGTRSLRSIKATGSNFPIFFRRLSSDRAYLYRNFVERPLSHIALRANPSLIVDLGAYAGFSTRVFAELFPSARVVGIEAVAENVAIASKNLSPFPNVELVHGAISNRRRDLALLQIEPENWNFTTTDRVAGLPTVQAIALPHLFESFGEEPVSILKIDLHGAEYEVLLDNLDLVSERCKCLVVCFSHARARARELAEIESSLQLRGISRRENFSNYRVYSAL